MNGSIKIGLAGIGRAGYGNHCKELKGKEHMFQIVAACDLIPGRLETMREQYGCRTYDRIEELVLDEGVDLIDIATRSVDHLRHAKMALEAGKYLIKKYKRDALLSQRQLAVKN